MSKTLYEAALADVRQIKAVAESNAKRAIESEYAPRIKALIESHLINESIDDEDEDDENDNLLTDDAVLGASHPALDANSSNTEESEDDKDVSEDDEYEITNESLVALLPIIKKSTDEQFENKVYRVVESTNELVTTSQRNKITSSYKSQVDKTISEIEDMYSYLQESNLSRKNKLEEKLESCYEILKGVKESTMRIKDLMKEDKDLTLKVTGLPDDINIENLNIDVISDEEDADMSGDPSQGMPSDPSAAPAPPAPVATESDGGMLSNLDDLDEEDVVEIDEGMLRREISKMRNQNKRIAEQKIDGHKMTSDILSSFGDGSDEGEPWLDGEVSTADDDNMVNQGTVAEADEPDPTEHDDDDSESHCSVDEAKTATSKAGMTVLEAMSRVQIAEKRAAAHKASYRKVKGTRHEDRARQATVKAIKETVIAKACLAEAKTKFANAQKTLKESLKIRDSKSQLAAQTAAIESLRAQLTETNLFNAKLIYANKLLQNESISAEQKSQIIDKLDESKSLREAKLVYEGLIGVLKKTVNESASSRKVLAGATSRVTKPTSSSTLNESVETSRWAKLAGLK